MTGMELLDEKIFTPFNVLPGDSIHFTYSQPGLFRRKKVIAEHTEHITKPGLVNCFRIYRADEFDGLEDCYMIVVGYKK